MTERPPEEKPLPTIWRVPDELWEKIESILSEHDPPKKTGHLRAHRRGALDLSSSGSAPTASETACLRSSRRLDRAPRLPAVGGAGGLGPDLGGPGGGMRGAG